MGNEQTSIMSAQNKISLTEAEKKGLIAVDCSVCKDKKLGTIRFRCLKCKGQAVTLAENSNPSYEDFDSQKWLGKCFNCKGKKDLPLEFIANCATCRTENLPITMECSICFCDNRRGAETASMSCGHHFCHSCYGTYLTTCIRESKLIETADIGCYSLKCPEPNCRVYVEEVHFIKSLVSRDDYELFKDITFNMYNTKNNAVHCPNAKCGAIMIPNNNREVKIACWNCSRSFCKDCHCSWHENMTCAQYRISLDPALVKALEQNAMSCPSCKQLITKVSGTCNHMKCPCGTNFCFQCGKEWPANALEKRGIKVHALGIGKQCKCPLWGAK